MIRLFDLRDLSVMRQLQSQCVGFDLRRLLLCSPSPMQSALADYFTLHSLGTITCVHRDADHGGINGFVQIWPRAVRNEWDLAFLSPSLDYHRDAAEIWYKLLTHLTVLAAESGVLRIYARSSEDAEAEDIFRQVGYTLINREEVFVLPQQVAPTPLPKGLRRITTQDRWALNEFYRSVVPQLVHKAGGVFPHRGGVYHGILARPLSIKEYVWADKDTILAYLGLCSSSKGHWLEIVVRPEYRAETLPYIKYVLTLAPCSASRPVYCPVPDFCVGLGWPLRNLGFEAYARQVLMVIHTVAHAPIRRPIVVPGLEGGHVIGPVRNSTQVGLPEQSVS